MAAHANPDSIEVFVEVNPQTNRVRATAIGSMEMRAQEMGKVPDPEECRLIAAKSMNLALDQVELCATSSLCTIFQGKVEERHLRLFRSRRFPIRVLDRQGFIKVQRSDGVVYQLKGDSALKELKRIWEEMTLYKGDSIVYPDLFLIVGSHIMDLSGVQSLDHALGLVAPEIEGIKSDEPVVIVGCRGASGF